MVEGKTKIITPLWSGADIGAVTTKDDITAGDGKKHDIMVGKAELATRTTCNVFDLLKTKGVPLAYIGRDSPTTFLTKLCMMIPVEVVVRRVAVASSSYLKRHPKVAAGTRFDELEVEFFYKTTNQKLGNITLPCDDPLMILDLGRLKYDLYFPTKPTADGLIGPLDLPDCDTRLLIEQLDECAEIAKKVFSHLELAWDKLDGSLDDFKLEFGVLPDGSVVLADVIDCDSWKVMWNNLKLSKQGYRDGDGLNRVLGTYRLAASLTDQMA